MSWSAGLGSLCLLGTSGGSRLAVLASADHRNDRAGEADPARVPTQDDYQAMRDAYLATAPDPLAFDAVAEKTVRLVHSFTGWTDDQVRGVQLPVLIVIGDTDIIRVENAALALRLLPPVIEAFLA